MLIPVFSLTCACGVELLRDVWLRPGEDQPTPQNESGEDKALMQAGFVQHCPHSSPAPWADSVTPATSFLNCACSFL